MLITVIIGPVIIYLAYQVQDKNESNRYFSNIIADNINACSDSNISEDAFNEDSDLVHARTVSLISRAIVLMVVNVVLFVIQFWLIPQEPDTYGLTENQETLNAEQEA